MLSFFPGKSSVNKAVVLLFKMSLGSFLLLSPHSCSWTVAEVRDELILIFKNIFYFIVCFGCAGSPLLPGLFSSCGE